ncbi:MAG: hypothetical protein ABSD41_09200 [Candidatus Bathyarchaeia archaeon]|jgi:membrane-associated phospholipid phosphatase
MTSEKTASIISIALNPTIIAGFAFLLLVSQQNIQTSFLLMTICLTFGTLVPLVMVYQLSRRGIVSDYYVSQKEERAKPFAGAIISYLVGSGVLLLVNAPPIITAFMLCYAGNTMIMMIITLRWKISIHAAGIAGPTTGLIYGIGVWAAVFFTLLVPVGWARVRLKAHTPLQMLAGGLVTIAATWIQMRIYLFSLH